MAQCGRRCGVKLANVGFIAALPNNVTNPVSGLTGSDQRDLTRSKGPGVLHKQPSELVSQGNTLYYFGQHTLGRDRRIRVRPI